MKTSLLILLAVLGLSSIGARLLLEKSNRGDAKEGDLNTLDARYEKLARTMRGAVVFHRKNGELVGNRSFRPYYQRNIYKVTIGPGLDRTPVELAKHGRRPRWSPDGKFIAFIRDKSIMRMTAEGTGEEQLATANEEPRSLAYHPNGRAVIFTDDRTLKSVDLTTRKVKTLLEGPWFHEVDISEDGKTAVATIRRVHTYHVMAYDLETGDKRELGAGCSASLSPDGERATNNIHGHEQVVIRRVSDGRELTRVDHPGTWTFDNQFFSNHDDWITSVNEGMHNEIFVHRVSLNSWTQITSCGDCDYPDLFIEQAP